MVLTAASITISAGVFVSLLIAFLLPLLVSGEHAKEAAQKARARRLAEAKLNARLLRLNL